MGLSLSTWHFRKVEELVRKVNLLSFPFYLRKRSKLSNEQCLFMGLRWTKKWKTILKTHSSCIICAHISLATHIPHNYYGARNTLKLSFPIIVWVRDGLAQHMVGSYAKPLSWGIVFSILTAFSVSGVLGEMVHNWCPEPKVYRNKNNAILACCIFKINTTPSSFKRLSSQLTQ